MARKPSLEIKLDPNDPRMQVWHVAGMPPFRLTAAQARQTAAISLKLAEEQERHAAGAKIVLPVGVERLQ